MKRIIEWVLWDRTRALATFAVLSAALMLGIAFSPGGSSADEPKATAAPSSSSTGTPTVTIPPLPTPTYATPTPSVPSATPTLPGAAAKDASTPEGAADRFVRTYLQVRDMDRAEWENALIAMSTGTNMTQLIRNVQESMIPAAQVITATEQQPRGARATVKVPVSNGDTYVVILTPDSEGIWRVVSADPYGGGE